MALKKKVLIGLTSVSLMIPSMALAVEEEQDEAMGGWVEGEGYWTNNDSDIGALSEPDNHDGWREAGPNEDQYRSVGVTTWHGQYHYTRALMEGHIWGTVYADSGRVYGTGSTEARSPWTERNAFAQTFWGTS
ncbi:hypothetical protein B0H94_103258 [Salsuginibacillus halophilus]|uniref:Bacteriocin n=2 Tax=Bacillaceae TaxID=186817 RepID=A0A840QT91_9BACI|nr:MULTISPECIES: hypothetical protein [Bacillaceae]MBB5174487.1 hypothetical protein [Texcoconibacillus texcoconensis]PSL50645.1 hypothetical protein B0H94_103258 [Salsuginibacillus halophilus]